MLYLFEMALKRAFWRCMGWERGVGDHIFEKFSRQCPRFGDFQQVYAGFFCPILACRTVSVDFTEHGVPEGGCIVPFWNNVGKGFPEMYGFGLRRERYV